MLRKKSNYNDLVTKLNLVIKKINFIFHLIHFKILYTLTLISTTFATTINSLSTFLY